MRIVLHRKKFTFGHELKRKGLRGPITNWYVESKAEALMKIPDSKT